MGRPTWCWSHFSLLDHLYSMGYPSCLPLFKIWLAGKELRKVSVSLCVVSQHWCKPVWPHVWENPFFGVLYSCFSAEETILEIPRLLKLSVSYRCSCVLCNRLLIIPDQFINEFLIWFIRERRDGAFDSEISHTIVMYWRNVWFLGCNKQINIRYLLLCFAFVLFLSQWMLALLPACTQPSANHEGKDYCLLLSCSTPNSR